jgi:carbon storage regulator
LRHVSHRRGGFETEVIMLVLSRMLNETIVLDGGIEIVVTEIRKHKVRIGVKAPVDVGIYRKEIAEKIAQQGKLKIEEGQPQQPASPQV